MFLKLKKWLLILERTRPLLTPFILTIHLLTKCILLNVLVVLLLLMIYVWILTVTNCWWKLKSFNVNNTILLSFYRSIVESILTSSITVWYDKASVYHKDRIDSVVRQAERIINISLPSIESIYLNRMTNKTTKILKDKHHPAHDYFQLL